MGQTEVEELTLTQIETERQHYIVLYNDEVNTFDWVIESLVDVCDHSFEQAEQCSIIVHYKGKCDVKSGSYTDLKPQCTELLNRGIKCRNLLGN